MTGCSEDFSSVLETRSESNANDHARTILHFDIDCFYAQVEMIKDPSLKEKPLGIQQKNIVVTCNYKAREMGVIKCSYIRDALKVCPGLVLVNGEDLAEYRRYSQKIFNLIREEGGKCPVERLGMDENFMDATQLVAEEVYQEAVTGHVYNEQDPPPDNACKVKPNCFCVARLKIGSAIAQRIRSKVFDAFGITMSCGIGHNKTVAKLVGSANKPNKQTVILPADVSSLMFSLKSVKKIPGIGSSTCKMLGSDAMGVSEVLDLGENELRNRLGGDMELAQRIMGLCQGVDDAPVKSSSEKPLSLGLEDRFLPLTTKQEVVEKLHWLINRLSSLLHEDGRQPQTIKVTMRDPLKDKHKFHKESRQSKINPRYFKSLKHSESLDADSHREIMAMVQSLLEKMIPLNGQLQLTLLGVAVTDFVKQDGAGISAFFSKPASKFREKATTAEIKSEVDQEVFSQLPDDIQQELVGSGSAPQPAKRRKVEHQALPHGWDPEVFSSLPDDLRQELLANQVLPKPVIKARKPNSIMDYFKKK